MNVSSRTPEGTPHECPLCGAVSNLEPAFPGGDAVCPACGQLVWWFRDRYGERLAQILEELTLDSSFPLDSLEAVGLIMDWRKNSISTFPTKTLNVFSLLPI